GADAKRLRLLRLRGHRDAGGQPEQATDAARNALHDISSVDGRKTGASREAGTGPMDTTICYREATFWLSPNTVNTPPCVLNLSASPKAPRAPRPAVGSSLLIPAATPMPAQPPIPERTATYCLPSG